jgi:hypothetical protein
MLAAFKFPAPTAMVLTPLGGLGIVIAPETLTVIPELVINELAAAVVNVIVEQAAFTVTVTVRPPSMNTLSPATGNDAPGAPPEVADHVAFTFQFPEATE